MPRGRRPAASQQSAEQQKETDRQEQTHHILSQEPIRSVAKLVVKDMKGNELARFEPYLRVEHIQEEMQKKGLAGKYFIRGVDGENKLLPTWVDLAVQSMESLGGGFFRPSQNNGESIIESTLARDQQAQLAKERDELTKLRLQLEEDRKQSLQEIQQRREETQSEHVQMMITMFKEQSDAERRALEEERRMRLEYDERRREHELEMKQAEQEREHKLQMERDRIEREREALHQKELERARLEVEKTIKQMEHEYNLKLELYQKQAQQQQEMMAQIQRMELDRKTRKLEAKYQNQLPTSVQEMYWQKQLEQMFPEKTTVDKMLDQLGPFLGMAGLPNPKQLTQQPQQQSMPTAPQGLAPIAPVTAPPTAPTPVTAQDIAPQGGPVPAPAPAPGGELEVFDSDDFDEVA